MKHVEIKLMNSEFCLLSSKKAKRTLEKNGFRSVLLSNRSNSVFVKISDLDEIKEKVPFYLLDEDDTELTKSDIKKIKEKSSSCNEEEI